MPSLRHLLPLLSLATVALSRRQRPLTGYSGGTNQTDDDNDTPLPVVIWHGLGDNYNNEGLREVGSIIQSLNEGTLVHYVSLGSSPNDDQSATFWGDVNEQVDTVCAQLAADQILSTAPAIDAVGFSQGGQFLRAYVQRCNRPPVRNLLTFGSQHNGIMDYKSCGALDLACRAAMALLHSSTFTDYVQGHLVPAQYYRDPQDLDTYLEYSHFLADINNERTEKNATYAANLATLDNFVMYMFADDTTVIPKESAWFTDVAGDNVTDLRDRDIYKEDWLGLKKLDKKGALHFRTIPGDHMQLSQDVLEAAFKPFFGPLAKKYPQKAAVYEDEL